MESENARMIRELREAIAAFEIATVAVNADYGVLDDDESDHRAAKKAVDAKIDAIAEALNASGAGGAASKPLRSMLVIGATLEDARDFIGRDFMGRIDNVAPRKLAIPDEIWPRDETMTAEFCTPDTIPMRAFDIVVATATAWFAAQRDEVIDDAVRTAVARIEKGGTLWLEPAESCIDCGATEGGSFTHDNGQRFHIDCPNGPGGRTLGRIAKARLPPPPRSLPSDGIPG